MKTTKYVKLMALILGMFIMTGVSACSDDDDKVWNEIPQPIATFIQKYWPGAGTSSFTKDKDEYTVQITDGPEIDFDLNYSWTDVDGEGMPLPQMFLYDQLPEKLYNYLESAQQLNGVFEAERDARQYKLELLNQELVYTISTGEIRSVPTSPTSPV